MYRSLKEIRASIPPHLFIRSTTKGFLYLFRDILMALAAWILATYIDPCFQSDTTRKLVTPIGAGVLKWAAWDL